MMWRHVEPVSAVGVFPRERRALLDVLAPLSDADWDRSTVCPGWAVRDIAAHLVADDLGRLSRTRDAYPRTGPRAGESVVAFIDRQNGEWVDAMRRMSPQVIVGLLEWTGDETQRYFESLDEAALDGSVWWATGDDPAPVWLDLGRELTERCHHQQQIRDAIGAPLLSDLALSGAVVATLALALPRTFRDVAAPDGTVVELVVRGDAGGAWTVTREGTEWVLRHGSSTSPTAAAELDEDDFWRLVTKGLRAADVEPRARLSGDEQLARRVLDMVSVIG
ncbi:MAG: maleylpyruvate isomerase family mycothiol-dependent enzyme [Chloroflexota bacterium]